MPLASCQGYFTFGLASRELLSHALQDVELRHLIQPAKQKPLRRNVVCCSGLAVWTDATNFE